MKNKNPASTLWILVILFEEAWCDRMVVGFTTTFVHVQSVPIITKIVSSNPAHGVEYLIQHYVINFVSVLWQVGAFL
jgi:hypothetical protein